MGNPGTIWKHEDLQARIMTRQLLETESRRVGRHGLLFVPYLKLMNSGESDYDEMINKGIFSLTASS
jgi:hypothetical protein